MADGQKNFSIKVGTRHLYLSGMQPSMKTATCKELGNGFLSRIRRSHRRISSSSRFLGREDGPRKSTLALAIESSCDDTCVAILEKRGPAARLLFNENISLDTRAKRGIDPADAVASHSKHLPGLVQKALSALPEATTNGTSTTEKVLLVPDAVSGQLILRRVPDLVVATRGPGFSASLATGINVAQGLAVAWGVPYHGAHHMQAHALTPRLVDALTRPMSEHDALVAAVPPSPAFPFLGLLVSGGHTLLVRSESLTDHAIISETIDVALGDMLDKCARWLLPPDILQSRPGSYGAALEAFAFPSGAVPDKAGHPSQPVNYGYRPPLTRADEIAPFEHPRYKWRLVPPLADVRAPEKFSFTGLGSAARRIAFPQELAAPREKEKGTSTGKGTRTEAPRSPDESSMSVEERQALGRVTMRLAFEHLASRVVFALQDRRRGRGRKINTLVVSGGVASNRFLMHVLRAVLDARGCADVRLAAPPLALCTDNAAMMAWAAIEMWEAGFHTELGTMARRTWSLDSRSEDGGILGADGWVRRDGMAWSPSW